MGRVDVHPNLVLLAHVRHGVQRVKRAHRSGTRTGHHRNHRMPLGFQALQGRVEPHGIQAMIGIDFGLDHLPGSQPHNAGRTGHAVMRFRLHHQHRGRAAPGNSRLPGIPQRHVAGSQQGRQIGRRPAMCHHTRRTGRVPANGLG